MTRHDITPILADIAATMNRVRDLDIEGHARAAALQCLADARGHLERHVPGAVWGIAEYAAEGRARLVFPTAQATRAELLETFPPPATDNQRVRNKATEAFRESRRILREVIK